MSIALVAYHAKGCNSKSSESGLHMKAIAFFNNKGGVGKTTLLCNVAAYLALVMDKKVLIVDADPQCNATQLLLPEATINKIYEDEAEFTIYSVIHPLSIGKGYAKNIWPRRVTDFGVDLVPGDPRLALKEDLLAQDWQSSVAGDIRGLRTSFLFADFLTRCEGYDFVFFDMGPSLGSINRAVLLACDFFLSPMSIDIFSLKAIENISNALAEWKKKLAIGVSQVEKSAVEELPKNATFSVQFVGYVAQQYAQKAKHGVKQAVEAYDKIMARIPKTIDKFLLPKGSSLSRSKYRIGEIPNLYSLIPMSQTAHKPIFNLKARDGVRGAHFSRVKVAEEIFSQVATQLVHNVNTLSNDQLAK